MSDLFAQMSVCSSWKNFEAGISSRLRTNGRAESILMLGSREAELVSHLQPIDGLSRTR